MTSPWVLLGGFFLFVLASVTAAGYWIIRRQAPAESASPESELLLTDDRASIKSLALAMLHAIGQWVPSADATRARIRRRLLLAGYRRISDVNAFFGMKCASALVTGLAFCAAAAWNGSSHLLSSLICGLGIGFLGPERFLDARIAERNDKLRRALPPALDLMVMSLEAGQNLDQAILLSSRGIRVFSPELSAELSAVYVQTRTGVARQDALQQMGEQTTEAEVRKFAQLLIDSDRFGSSLAPTLRQHARFLRIRSRQKAQEEARKLSVKLVFPVFFLIFPAVLVVTLGPAILTLLRNFKDFGN